MHAKVSACGYTGIHPGQRTLQATPRTQSSSRVTIRNSQAAVIQISCQRAVCCRTNHKQTPRQRPRWFAGANHRNSTLQIGGKFGRVDDATLPLLDRNCRALYPASHTINPDLQE
ncbi:MAG: hypothetical protein CMJ70_16880 [Planctomycetaceae bacterium]|nr:hypothetical protein [Planctomycetaceae bacterium]